jgi:hypothetical protein
MVTIQIFSQRTGEPLRNVSVNICFSGFWRGSSTTKYTDRKGEVHFNSAPGEGTIYAAGSRKHSGWISGRTILYL